MANAAVDLTTLPTLRARLGLGEVALSESDQGELARLITEASQRMHNEIGSSVIYRARIDTKDGDGGRQVWLDDGTPPAGEALWTCSVTSVVVDGFTVPAYVPAVGEVAASDGWRAVDGSRIDLVGTSYTYTRGDGNVVITYSAGFQVTPTWSVPSDIEGAVVELAAMKWKERDRIGQTYKVVGGEVADFRGSQVWSTFLAVAQAYHRVVV